MTAHDFARMLFHRVAPAFFYPTVYDKVPCYHAPDDSKYLRINTLIVATTVVELRAWRFEDATYIVGQCGACQKVYYQEKKQP
jgi:hypothetical protein